MMEKTTVARIDPVQRDQKATSLVTRWVLAALGAVVASLGGLTIAPQPALAKPTSCDYYRVDNDTMVGGCRHGTGQYRFFIGCDLPYLPDYQEYSAWMPAGSSVSVSCNWGNHAYPKYFVLEG
jgi:hypothetical protein